MQNIRRATARNHTGFLGVGMHVCGKYQARIRVNGKLIRIGFYESPQEAHEAYVAAKRKLHEGCTL